MKHLLIIVSLLCFSISQAQLSKLDQIFDQYKEGKGVTSIKIGKPMFSMLNKMKLSDNDLESIRPLLTNINSIKMLIVEGDTPELQSDVSKAINKLNYEELMVINSEENKIKFLAENKQSENINNLLLSIITDDSTIFMILDCRIKYDDISKLINSVN